MLRRGRLRANRDLARVGVGSRLIGDAVAALYAEHLPRYARGCLADLGCGQVPLYATYKPHVASVTCVDWPESTHAMLHVDQAVDLSAVLLFSDAAFDTVVLSDVLEHVPEPARLMREIARLLAPGGHLLANVPFLYGLHELPHDYYRYTEFALRRLAAEAGLQVLMLVAVGGSAEVLADFLAKHLASMPVLGAPLASLVQGLAAALRCTRAGRRWSERSATRFPLGYFMVASRPGATGPA